MRNHYCKALYEIMSVNDNVYALTADIGYSNFDRIRADFPERFINVGVAEANMIGIAAGMALSGKIPFVFTIAPFITMRCLEQIRVDLCYQKLNVKIIGVGAGFVYGAQGTTHHAIEDVGILRTLPQMNIICPADPAETEKAVHASMNLTTPLYIRLARNNEPVLTAGNDKFIFGKAFTMRQGGDITVIGYGPILKNVFDAAEILEKENIDVRIVNMHTVKPIDREAILKCAEETGKIITVEEHNIIGGLGSAVAEVLAEGNCGNIKFKRMGIQDSYCEIHANYEELQEEYGLNCAAVVKEIKNISGS